MKTTYPTTVAGQAVQTGSYPTGLRYLFVLGAIGSFATGMAAVFAPDLVVALTGLSPQAIPSMQQAGALALGAFAAAVLCLGSSRWSEVRITVVGSLVTFLLTTIGAFYYVVLQGIATPGLVLILAIAVVMTLGFGYYTIRYRRRGEMG